LSSALLKRKRSSFFEHFALNERRSFYGWLSKPLPAFSLEIDQKSKNSLVGQKKKYELLLCSYLF